mgnify:CR=1 FL=1
MTTTEKATALTWIDEHQDTIVDLHQRVWDLAEVGLQETQTSKLLADLLEADGFRVERGVAGMPTAFVATFGSGGPVIGLLAELDALPEMPPPGVSISRSLIDATVQRLRSTRA